MNPAIAGLRALMAALQPTYIVSLLFPIYWIKCRVSMLTLRESIDKSQRIKSSDRVIQ